MIINKVIDICNLGKFRNYHSGSSNWDGIFKKITVIYADNGGGKTTFTQIFKSLKGEAIEAFRRRETWDCQTPMHIKMLADNNTIVEFKNNVWSQAIRNIEVFDTFFVESNVYVIDANISNVVFGNNIIEGHNEIKKIKNIKSRLGMLFQELHNIQVLKNMWQKSTADVKNELEIKINKQSTQISRKVKRDGLNFSNEEMGLFCNDDELSIEIEQKINVEKRNINLAINNVKQNISNSCDLYGKQYLEKINYFLRLISPKLKITKLNNEKRVIVYHIVIDGHDVRTSTRSTSLHRSLSEGEKNALAFAYFFGKIRYRRWY